MTRSTTIRTYQEQRKVVAMRAWAVAAAIGLALHGLVHLMGAAVYLKLAEIAELPFKTTVLDGLWDLGENGIAVYGALWAIAALGFVVSAGALAAGRNWWRPALFGVALFSLVLTALDWRVAYMGVAINVGILAVLVVGPRVAGRLRR